MIKWEDLESMKGTKKKEDAWLHVSRITNTKMESMQESGKAILKGKLNITGNNEKPTLKIQKSFGNMPDINTCNIESNTTSVKKNAE